MQVGAGQYHLSIQAGSSMMRLDQPQQASSTMLRARAKKKNLTVGHISADTSTLDAKNCRISSSLYLS